jgi:hypothetical protein
MKYAVKYAVTHTSRTAQKRGVADRREAVGPSGTS